MMLPDLLSFCVVASLLVVSPGPNSALVAKTSASSGFKVAYANMAGFTTAYFVHGTLSILGISVILLHSAVLFNTIKYIGALYLVWIGIESLWSAFKKGSASASEKSVPVKKTSLGKAFMAGFLTNAFNPKVSMFFLAAFPQFIPVGGNVIASSVLLILIQAVMEIAWYTALFLLFSRLKSIGKNEKFQRWFKAFTGSAFIGFGLKLATFKP